MPATEPTLPTEIDYSVAPAYLRTVNCANAADFTTALADAQFGDKIVLTAGVTYTGQFTLKVSTGTLAGTGGDNWVTIISSAYASLPAAGTQVTISDITNMPTLVTSGGYSTYAIAASANAIHHYRFVGINFTTPAVYPGAAGIVYIAPIDATATANYPHHISFERCIVKPQYDFGTSYAVQVHANHFQVIDSHFDEVKATGDGEAKCIYSDLYSGPIKVHNNYLAGLGSNAFFGSSVAGGVAITAGYEYEQPRDITITNNTFYRKLQWKRDDATYIPQCDTAGTGTVSSSGTTVTFSTSQSGLTGKYIKGATSGAVGLVASGSGTSWVVSWVSGTAFSAGESWRYNSGNLSAKNMLEFKAGSRVYINGNTFENMWNDGQLFALTMTPRSFGYFEDFTITNNYFNNCCGPINFSVGDSAAGNGLGPSPYPSKRIRFSNNLAVGVSSTAMTSLVPNNYSWSISPFGTLFGSFNGQGGTIAASTTGGVGTSITFTGASNTPFVSYMVGQVMKYGTGAATITTFTDSTHLVGTVITAFPDTSAHAVLDWYIGPSAIVKTSVFHGDSWILEHNSIVGANSNFTSLPGILTSPDATTTMTNFVFRNNMMFHGNNPGSGGGFTADGGGLSGTTAITYLSDSSRVVSNNVYFGPQTRTGINYSTHYTNGEVIAFHDPDQTGSTLGGSVGFVDYAGGNFRVTGTYATAATDGTMVGVNMDTLNAALAGVTNTPRYLPMRWP